MIPEREIGIILKKFGPKVIAYLKQAGYWDLPEGPFQPSDIMNNQAMRQYLVASKKKNKAVWDVMEKHLLPELQGTGEAFIEAYGLEDVINVADISKKYIDARGGWAIKKMQQTDKSKLMNFIQQDSMKNERVIARDILREPDLASLVDNSGARAATIVRTETGRAIRGGSQDFAGGAGATTKTWHTVKDNRVRPTNKNDIGVPGRDHRMLEGKKIPIGDEFEAEGQFPGERSINCRCWLEYGFGKDVASNPEPSMESLEAIYA